MSIKKALITGVDGFVGPYLKKELENNGYLVFGLSQHTNDDSNRIIKCDIANRQGIFNILHQNNFDTIYHLAGFSDPKQAEKSKELVFQVNVDGTTNILDALVQFSSHTRILIVSSSYVYGGPEYLPIDEKHPLRGGGVYAESRVLQEQKALEYTNRLKLIVTRSFNHTGAGQGENFVIPKIIHGAIRVQRGLQTALELGNMQVKRDFTDVRDVVRAYRLLLEQDTFGIVCNVCRGESIALQEIIEYIKVTYELPHLPVRVSADLVKKGEPPNIYGDTSLLRSIIPWDNLITYPAMIDALYEFYTALTSN